MRLMQVDYIMDLMPNANYSLFFVLAAGMSSHLTMTLRDGLLQMEVLYEHHCYTTMHGV